MDLWSPVTGRLHSEVSNAYIEVGCTVRIGVPWNLGFGLESK